MNIKNISLNASIPCEFLGSRPCHDTAKLKFHHVLIDQLPIVEPLLQFEHAITKNVSLSQ
jgi:hypothetical protein